MKFQSNYTEGQIEAVILSELEDETDRRIFRDYIANRSGVNNKDKEKIRGVVFSVMKSIEKSARTLDELKDYLDD